jgi:hypothetical protein
VFQVFENLLSTPEITKGRAHLHVAAAQTQHPRKENSVFRAQSSNNHLARPGDQGEEVDQPELQISLKRQDRLPHINNHHRERDATK